MGSDRTTTADMSLGRALAAALAEPVADGEALFAAAESSLADLTAADTDGDLAERAARQEHGDTPLLGTQLRTHPYPALLWNGERFERLGARWPARLAFLAVVAAGPAPDRPRLARSVQLGESVRLLWPEPSAAPVAGLTTDSVAAAVCAAAAAGLPDHELGFVAEMAAALMLVTPRVHETRVQEIHAGHALASGWLALQLVRSGVVAAPGTAAEVLGTRDAP